MTTYFIAESSCSFDSTTLDGTLHATAADAWYSIALDYAATADDEAATELLASLSVPDSVTLDGDVTFTVKTIDVEDDDVPCGYATPDEARRYNWWPRGREN